MRPDYETLPTFYKGYVDLVAEMDLVDALVESDSQMRTLIQRIPESKADFSYAPEKWTIREVLFHVSDSERVFAYRALRFARGDRTELPGFDEKSYGMQTNSQGRLLRDLADELGRLRQTTVDLFNGFSKEMLGRTGVASGQVVSVVNLGYMIAGHALHHAGILNERYLQ